MLRISTLLVYHYSVSTTTVLTGVVLERPGLVNPLDSWYIVRRRVALRYPSGIRPGHGEAEVKVHCANSTRHFMHRALPGLGSVLNAAGRV
jgi:hypothetical protein